MLAYLLSGEYATAGELAATASVSAATASGHLAKMLDAAFVVCEQRGRHRYYRLAGPEVAHALEALALVAERDCHDRAWAHPERQRLRLARCCYGHLAGALAVELLGSLVARDHLAQGPDGFELTDGGAAWLATLGMTPGPRSARRRYAYRCLDWSERRDHLAGQLAEEMFRHFLERDWLRRTSGRAIEVTVAGRRELLPRLQSAA